MKKEILYWQNPEIVEVLTQSLKENKVSIVATDTIFGLTANANQENVEKLDLLKNRCDKPYILLLDSIEKIFLFVETLDEKILQFLKLCWPGPVTIIFNFKKKSHFYMKTSGNTIGIRIPNHPKLLEVLKNFNGLFSTSANVSGQLAPNNILQVNPQILDKIDMIVLDQNSKEENLPSTILDCTRSNIKVIREGLYPVKKLEELYGESFIK